MQETGENARAVVRLTLDPSQHRAALLGRGPLGGLLVLKLRKLRAAIASSILPARSACHSILPYNARLGRALW